MPSVDLLFRFVSAEISVLRVDLNPLLALRPHVRIGLLQVRHKMGIRPHLAPAKLAPSGTVLCVIRPLGFRLRLGCLVALALRNGHFLHLVVRKDCHCTCSHWLSPIFLTVIFLPSCIISFVVPTGVLWVCWGLA